MSEQAPNTSHELPPKPDDPSPYRDNDLFSAERIKALRGIPVALPGRTSDGSKEEINANIADYQESRRHYEQEFDVKTGDAIDWKLGSPKHTLVLEKDGSHIYQALDEIRFPLNKLSEQEIHQIEQAWEFTKTPGSEFGELVPKATKKKDESATVTEPWEKSPDSIGHNYTVKKKASNLRVAESKTNHSHKEHPHPVGDNGLGTAEHEKVRGIVYRETELAGKPFIIAERGRPHKSPSPSPHKVPHSSHGPETPVPGPADKRPERRTDNVFTAPSVEDDAYPTHVDPSGPAGPKPKLDPKKPSLTENEQLLDSLTNEMNAARTEYARLKVARDRRILHVGRLRKEELAKAKRHLDWVSDRLKLHERNMALKAGVSPEDLNTYAYMSDVGNAERLASALYREHLLATGKYKHEAVPAIKRRASGKPIRTGPVYKITEEGEPIRIEGEVIPIEYRRDKKGKSEPVYELKKNDRGEPVLKKTVHGSFLGRLASRGMVTDAHIHLTGRDVGLPDRAFRAPHEAFDQLEQGKKSKA